MLKLRIKINYFIKGLIEFLFFFKPTNILIFGEC
jgi:hypothetical protein